MKNSGRKQLCMLLTLILTLCLIAASCGRERTDDSSDSKASTVAEQTEKPAAEEQAAPEESSGTDAASEESDKVAEEKKATEEKAAKEKDKKEKKDKEKTEKSKKSSGSSQSKSKPAEKKKVWVEPVTETRTVTLDTGTRYCNGPKSNGGCGASWHGTKDSTYDQWYDHWQDYVKKRTEEEAAKGEVYACDHIHDDSRWVPDTKTETVVVQEGYWKEVD